MPYLQFLLRCPILPQLKHLVFRCLLIPLEIASPIQASLLWSNDSTLAVCRIHSSIGASADLTFKGPSIFCCCCFSRQGFSVLNQVPHCIQNWHFSKASNSISTHLASGSVTPVCTDLDNLCKKSLKCSLGPCMTLVYDSVLILVLESCPKHSRLLYGIGTRCVHCK